MLPLAHISSDLARYASSEVAACLRKICTNGGEVSCRAQKKTARNTDTMIKELDEKEDGKLLEDFRGAIASLFSEIIYAFNEKIVGD